MKRLQAFKTAKKRVGRKRHSAASPAPAAPTLMSAAYNPDAATVTLVFDRAINIDAFDGTGLTVDDGEHLERRYDGTGGSDHIAPETVRVNLLDFGASTQPYTLLTVEGGNGIVAANDAAEWAGCTDLQLPFG